MVLAGMSFFFHPRMEFAGEHLSSIHEFYLRVGTHLKFTREWDLQVKVCFTDVSSEKNN